MRRRQKDEPNLRGRGHRPLLRAPTPRAPSVHARDARAHGHLRRVCVRARARSRAARFARGAPSHSSARARAPSRARADDDEFNALCADVRAKIAEVGDVEEGANPIHGGAPKAIKAAEGLLGQVKDLIAQMELEVRSNEDASAKKAAQAKVQNYKDDHSALQVRDEEAGARRERRARSVRVARRARLTRLARRSRSRAARAARAPNGPRQGRARGADVGRRRRRRLGPRLRRAARPDAHAERAAAEPEQHDPQRDRDGGGDRGRRDGDLAGARPPPREDQGAAREGGRGVSTAREREREGRRRARAIPRR